jgi:uncharacterized membrane protein
MTRKIFLLEILLTAAALAATVIAWPYLPETIPIHWNLHGRPDGYGPRWEIFLIGPGSMAAMMMLTWLLPWLSPRNFQVDAFRSTYRQVMLMLFSLSAYLCAVMLWSAFGHPIDEGRAIIGGACLLIALLGNLMGKVRRNFYIGVRTPWTLANERVWNATHRFAGKTLVAGGLVGLVLVIFGLISWPIYALLAAALAPVLYSLVYYKQLERRGELEDGLANGKGE